MSAFARARADTFGTRRPDAPRRPVRPTGPTDLAPRLETLERRTLLSGSPGAAAATEPPPGTVYQAESAALSGPLPLSNVPGFTGTGFADYQRSRGDFVEFVVDVPAAGEHTLEFRYANGSASDRPLELRVDGQVTSARPSFAPTGSWRTWKTVGQTLALPAGRHAVRLTSVGSNGPNLDALTVTRRPPPPPPVTLQAESAALGAAAVRRGIPGFTGTGYVDYQLGRGDFVEFTYDAPIAGAYQLDFRYANGSAAGTNRPLELKVNGAVEHPAVPFHYTGSWFHWSLSSTPATLAAGVNRIRLTTTGANGPNLDALTLTARPAAGAVTYVIQNRSVSGGLRQVYEVYNDETEEFEEVEFTAGDARSAPDFGDFDASVAAEVTPPPGERSGIASATQRSRLADDGIFVSGEVRGRTLTEPGSYEIASIVDVKFDLDRPRDYLLDYNVQGESTANPRVRISLTDLRGGAAVFDERSRFGDSVIAGTRAGTLAPGRYRYVMTYEVGGDVGTVGPYAVDFALTP